MGKRSRADEISDNDDGDSPLDAASPAKIQEVFESLESPSLHKMQCFLPPHPPLSFSSTVEFDIHYAKEHTNRCSSCGKNFPSAHYLALHIDENHNPLREAVAAQGEKTYSCFVEGCEKKCSTPQKRRLHLIDKHLFPKSYNFRIVAQGIDKTSTLLLTGPRRRLSTVTQTFSKNLSSFKAQSAENSSVGSVQTAETASNAASSMTDDVKDEGSNMVEGLESAFAALRFVPPSVQARQRSNKKKAEG